MITERNIWFCGIVDVVEEVSRLAGDIARATDEQQQVAETTSRGMAAITVTVEQTSASVASVADTAGETADTAKTLGELVSHFRLR